MKISTKEKIQVLYDELINKHQSDCFDNPKFSGLCVRKIKMMLTWLSFASYSSLWAYPEGDPINMTRTEALVYLVSTLSSLKCVKTVSRFSINTVKLVPIACKPAYWYLSQTIIIIRIICKLTILFYHSLIIIPNNHDPLLKTFIKG